MLYMAVLSGHAQNLLRSDGQQRNYGKVKFPSNLNLLLVNWWCSSKQDIDKSRGISSIDTRAIRTILQSAPLFSPGPWPADGKFNTDFREWQRIKFAGISLENIFMFYLWWWFIIARSIGDRPWSEPVISSRITFISLTVLSGINARFYVCAMAVATGMILGVTGDVPDIRWKICAWIRI